MTWAAVLAGLVVGGGAQGGVIEIVNPSFEITSRPLLINEQTNGMAGAGVPVATRFPFGDNTPSWSNPVEVAGWRTLHQPPPSVAINRAGVLRPGERQGAPFIQGIDGEHVFANQVSRAGQVLNHVLQPSTTYRLDFLGGIGRFDSNYFFAVSLISVPTLDTLPLDGTSGVDARRLAITSGLQHPADAIGQMRPYFLEYTTPSVLPPEHAGRLLGITLFGSDGIPRVLLDDFRLQATAIPGPGVGLVVIALVLRGRQRTRN